MLLFMIFGIHISDTSSLSLHHMKDREPCQLQVTHASEHFVLNDEAAIMKCPVLQYFHMDFSKAYEEPFHFVWDKNGPDNINTEDGSRIHINQDALWFMPAAMEDSGTYTCTVRNSSFCVEISMSLTVVSNADNVDLSNIEYEQIAYEHSNVHLSCPDLTEFGRSFGEMKLKWYKNGEPLVNENSRFQYLDGTTYALINDVHHDDAGYYKCQFDFFYENREISVSRIISLQTKDEPQRQIPVIVQPSPKSLVAEIGSKLVIPCKVYTASDESSLMVWWLANQLFVDEYSSDGRVVEGTSQKSVDKDGQYLEVPLIFEKVEEQDFKTDFRCIASNFYGHDDLPTKIKQAGTV